jgi:hypothetical protein
MIIHMPKIPTNDAPRNAYLRNRPFLTVFESRSPAPGARTTRAHWMNAKTLRVEEKPAIAYKISDTLLFQSTIIIDLRGHRVVKNRTDSSDAIALETYLAKYSQLINSVIR